MNQDPTDWTTVWHAAVLLSAHKDATCRLCGATAQKAIHDEAFARSRGYEFVRTEALSAQ